MKIIWIQIDLWKHDIMSNSQRSQNNVSVGQRGNITRTLKAWMRQEVTTTVPFCLLLSISFGNSQTSLMCGKHSSRPGIWNMPDKTLSLFFLTEPQLIGFVFSCLDSYANMCAHSQWAETSNGLMDPLHVVKEIMWRTSKEVSQNLELS